MDVWIDARPSAKLSQVGRDEVGLRLKRIYRVRLRRAHALYVKR